MKKSEFIKDVLNDWDNTVFVNKEQVEVALALFQKLGMVPPLNNWDLNMDGDHADPDDIRYYTWEDE